MQDKVDKGRQSRQGHPRKLSDEQAKKLRSEYNKCYGDIKSLADKYNINRNTVREYLKRTEDDLWTPPSTKTT